MIEREQNSQNVYMMEQIKKQLDNKIKECAKMYNENETLINRVAMAESKVEMGDNSDFEEKLKIQKEKNMEYKTVIVKQKEKIFALEKLLEERNGEKDNALLKLKEAKDEKDDENRIEDRIRVIVKQKESMFKQEKQEIMDKYCKAREKVREKTKQL